MVDRQFRPLSLPGTALYAFVLIAYLRGNSRFDPVVVLGEFLTNKLGTEV